VIEKKALEAYLKETFEGARLIRFERLGSGVHGTGFSLIFDTSGGRRNTSLKALQQRASATIIHPTGQQSFSLHLMNTEPFPSI